MIRLRAGLRIGEGERDVVWAARFFDYDRQTIGALADSGADVHAADELGVTALHLAALN